MKASVADPQRRATSLESRNPRDDKAGRNLAAVQGLARLDRHMVFDTS